MKFIHPFISLSVSFFQYLINSIKYQLKKDILRYQSYHLLNYNPIQNFQNLLLYFRFDLINLLFD